MYVRPLGDSSSIIGQVADNIQCSSIYVHLSGAEVIVIFILKKEYTVWTKEDITAKIFAWHKCATHVDVRTPPRSPGARLACTFALLLTCLLGRSRITNVTLVFYAKRHCYRIDVEAVMCFIMKATRFLVHFHLHHTQVSRRMTVLHRYMLAFDDFTSWRPARLFA